MLGLKGKKIINEKNHETGKYQKTLKISGNIGSRHQKTEMKVFF